MNRELFVLIGALALLSFGVALFCVSKRDADDSNGLQPLGIVIAVIGLACSGIAYVGFSDTLPSAKQEASK